MPRNKEMHLIGHVWKTNRDDMEVNAGGVGCSAGNLKALQPIILPGGMPEEIRFLYAD